MIWIKKTYSKRTNRTENLSKFKQEFIVYEKTIEIYSIYHCFVELMLNNMNDKKHDCNLASQDHCTNVDDMVELDMRQTHE